jgi:hypothetical protein
MVINVIVVLLVRVPLDASTPLLKSFYDTFIGIAIRAACYGSLLERD